MDTALTSPTPVLEVVPRVALIAIGQQEGILRNISVDLPHQRASVVVSVGLLEVGGQILHDTALCKSLATRSIHCSSRLYV